MHHPCVQLHVLCVFCVTVTTLTVIPLHTRIIWIQHILRVLRTQLIWCSQRLPVRNIRSLLLGLVKQAMRGIRAPKTSRTDLFLVSCKCPYDSKVAGQVTDMPSCQQFNSLTQNQLANCSSHHLWRQAARVLTVGVYVIYLENWPSLWWLDFTVCDLTIRQVNFLYRRVGLSATWHVGEMFIEWWVL